MRNIENLYQENWIFIQFESIKTFFLLRTRVFVIAPDDPCSYLSINMYI